MTQDRRDKARMTYRLTFPSDLDVERVEAWIRTLSGTLKTSLGRFVGVETVALEVIVSSQGITHRIKVPWKHARFIVGQLRALVPGIQISQEEEWPTFEFNRAVEIGLTNTTRTLNIRNQVDISHSLLQALRSVEPGEVIVLQWVITPAAPQHKPQHKVSKTTELKWTHLLTGDLASPDEIDDRRKKLDEPNLLAVLRVGAKASTNKRAEHLIQDAKSAMLVVRGPSTKFTKRFVGLQELNSRMRKASGVVTFPMQLSASEMTALIAWPIGNPQIPGLSVALSRQLPAHESVERNGRVIGMSNFFGAERPVAIGYAESNMHLSVTGGTGTGKTTLLENLIRQDIENGYGAILIERKGDLFRHTLNNIPKDRVGDVIVLDVNDTLSPVGFNVLKQGSDSAVAVDELIKIFDQMFKDNPSIWAREFMYHGLHTLAEDPNATITDLAALALPDETEVGWSNKMTSQVTDPGLRSYWRRFYALPAARREQMIQPVLSRVWPLARTKLLNIVGQSSSSFHMDDVLRRNKILLVNLSGIERESAALMGTFLLNSVWNSAKALKDETTKTNFLYLDEAHHYMNIPVDVDEMLVEARSMNLSVTLATQYMNQYPTNIRDAVLNSARSKVVFQSAYDDARDLARALGSGLTDQDITNLPRYEAIARVMTPAGQMAPFSMSTLPPSRPTGTAGDVIAASRAVYGRDVGQVREDIIKRRQDSTSSTKKRRPRLSGSDWGQPLS